MSKKILIVSQSHLCKNPRVLKESITLESAGYKVTILTAIYSRELLNEDLELLLNTNIKYFFFSNLSRKNLNSFFDKLVRKFAIFAQSKFKLESKFSLGYGVHRLKSICKTFDADLYIMHQELPTVVGCELIKLQFKVAFDFEDWYSRDLLPEAQKKRPITLLNNSEKYALDYGIACWTTSSAMANEFRNTFKLSYTPGVVYNSFHSAIKPSNNKLGNSLKLFWLSQTIGPGRGLEFFIEAIAKSKYSWNLILRGNITNEFHRTLKAKVNKKDFLIILPQIPFNEIISDLSNYDYGIAPELKTPPNKDLTIANKLFYYLSGGLPIIASDTSGNKEILLKHSSAGYVYQQFDVSSLVDVLNTIGLNSSKTILYEQKRSVLLVNEKNYCWDLERKKILKIVEQIFVP